MKAPRQSRAACHALIWKKFRARDPIPVSIKNVKLVHLPAFWNLSQLPILRGKCWNDWLRTFSLLKGSFWASLGKRSKEHENEPFCSHSSPLNILPQITRLKVLFTSLAHFEEDLEGLKDDQLPLGLPATSHCFVLPLNIYNLGRGIITPCKVQRLKLVLSRLVHDNKHQF